MSQTLELPDPLFAEINGYAARLSTSPLGVVRQAWEEFRDRHPQASIERPASKPTKEEMLAMIEELSGSITLPSGVDDKTLISEARLEKYGPL